MGNVQPLLALSRVIDAFNLRVGKYVSWLILIVVLVSAANASVRKIFDTSSNSWLELQWILFSVVFLLCSPWTLLANEHIRIDIVSSRLPARTRHTIDIVGHVVFLIPLCALMIYEAWPYFWRSIASGEISGNAGGLIRWPVKALIVVGFALLLLQGLSELIKRVAVRQGLIADPHATKSGSH